MNAPINNVAETLRLLKEAMAAPNNDILNSALAKAWVQPGSAVSGLNAYSLEAPAKLLYPVITPLRNSIPRVTGGVGIQANWRAITGINTGSLAIGVSEGNRGGVQASSTADYFAAFRGIGMEDYVTFEAQYAGQTFDDVRARAVQGLLRGLMIGEEKVLLGGNTSLALGTTPTPTAVGAITGGSLAAATYSVICVALTLDAMLTGSVAGGIRAAVTRPNADGTSDTYGGGSAKKSVAASATVASGSAGSIAASVAAVNGAVGYAWFWGASGSEVLGAITSINSIVITATAAGTQTAASLGTNDNSQNGLVFDGLLTQAFKPGSGAYILVQPTGTIGAGTPLTSDNAGGIVEFDKVLQALWDNYRLSPSKIWVASQEMNNVGKKILAAPSTAAQRFVFNAEQGMIAGGVAVRSYLNKFTMEGMKEIPIGIHPNLTPGTVLFDTEELPYPLSNVASVRRVLCRQDYYQLEWPLKTRKYEYGVYADEVLQHYFPPSMAVITNIANG